jgi:uncharacterized repeat protein (TIGR01451 family)
MLIVPHNSFTLILYYLRLSIVTTILLSSNWLEISRSLAVSPPPGIITNKATASFIDEEDGSNTEVGIESNTVQITVVEVAGITVTAGGASGSTVTGGLVYFDFVLTNVGNDPTQFFIPDAPSTPILGGNKTGDIKIVSYDSDGSGTNAAVDLDVTVPSGGRNTGTLLSGMTTANNGSIPAGGTIRIRIPITIAGASGNVEVTMGDTLNNGQNEAYTDLTVGSKDIFTVDNLDNVVNETANPPANGEREASLTQSLQISITTNTTNAPTLTCSSERRILNSAYNGVGGFSTTGRDTYWDSAIGTDSGPPPTTGWIDAYRTGNKAPGSWINSPYGDAGWISHFANTDHTAAGNPTIDIYFRYQFNLDSTVDVNSFQLMMDFLGDNSVADIFINGISQQGNYPTVLPQAATNPYYFQGSYRGTTRAALTLTNNWQTGSNEIIVQVKSGVPLVGLVAQSLPSYLCKSDGGDAPISYGTAPHQIVTDPKVYIGSVPLDADNYRDAATPIATPVYNDNTIGGDEDAFTTPLKAPISGNYKLTVPVRNTSGGVARLYGWIDFNRDGKFQVGESQVVNVANNASSVDLTWTGPSGAILGASYVRFRLTTNNLTDDGATMGVDERSIVTASDGEVEDYSIDLLGNPNLLLVKRITAINNLPAKRNGDLLNLYENSPSAYDDNVPTILTQLTKNDPQRDTNKWPDTVADTSSRFLLGAIDGGTIKPNDAIEYTIYFLSTGDIPAKKVLFCDRVPQNVTFIPTAFNGLVAGANGLTGADRGIAVNLSGTLKSYTNVGNDDFAQYFPPNIEPNTVFPNIVCGSTNTNGAVVINLGNITNATAISTPGSYGFVRFQGQVK